MSVVVDNRDRYIRDRLAEPLKSVRGRSVWHNLRLEDAARYLRNGRIDLALYYLETGLGPEFAGLEDAVKRHFGACP